MRLPCYFTSTVSQPAPVSENAPTIINNTYSSSNLLGLLLANTFVQAVFNNSLTKNTNYPPSTALYTNYSINLDNLCTGINLVNNQIKANNCGATSGTKPSYSNVLSLYDNSQTTANINLWDAILTGSDITATNGYMSVANPTIAAFSPPTQLVNNTASPTLTITGINTTFNATTGIFSVASYTTGLTGDPTSPGLTPAPTGLPQLNFVTSNWNLFNPPNYTSSNSATSPAYYSYDSTSGIITVNGYWGLSSQNGPQTLDMTTCLPNSPVNLTVYPFGDASGTPGSQANGYLICQSPPTLPYNACTNDQNATGGVIVAVTNPPAADGTGATFELGCACIPYLPRRAANWYATGQCGCRRNLLQSDRAVQLTGCHLLVCKDHKGGLCLRSPSTATDAPPLT